MEGHEFGQVVRRNKDLLAGRPTDMPGIDPNFLCHKLSVCREAKPVAQQKRKIEEERKKAVEAEVSKLLEAGFIREIQYTIWLANVVMVKKANGKWRMCTDYTDLNKACPKDAYPLPNIDRLVDGAAGHKFLTFLDAYSGYNQIRMHTRDEDKMAFVTKSSNYCYQVMPFGLKNAGATYQRLMDKIFGGQIGKNMEVYVDDMVVKSASLPSHVTDLAEVFHALRKHQMRLNPDKCVFGVSGSKFLGFMLSSRGIEANPDKCQAIIDMRSPSNLKEVQKLAGRLTALSRFLPCMAETSKPILGLLKKANRFQWTNECETSFQLFKKCLGTPPVLTKPIPGREVILYLAVSGEAISAGLIQEQDGQQQPIYFISRVLQDAERRYQLLEKALGLIYAARRLRQYF
uniref:Retrovirus-related Pol polyprotein from transposon 17.6 n=1 Tax=Cajanus cajan TaxID=3821 RepID=A0A151RX93_CAJCA|nr:Retrovirus-related Pol polyprotein from transposon 17.6 [Cajanus cajan]